MIYLFNYQNWRYYFFPSRYQAQKLRSLDSNSFNTDFKNLNFLKTTGGFKATKTKNSIFKIVESKSKNLATNVINILSFVPTAQDKVSYFNKPLINFLVEIALKEQIISQLNVGINDYFYKLTIHKNQIQLFEYQYDGQSKMVLSQDLLFEHKQHWKKIKANNKYTELFFKI